MAKNVEELTPKAKRMRELIYRTALEMLAEKGYKATTVRDICNRANVSIGAFYAYFESKNAILFEVIRNIDHYFTDEVAGKLSSTDGPESILSYFRYYTRYLEEEISFDTLCVIFNVEDIWLTRTRPAKMVLQSILMEGQLKDRIRKDIDASTMTDYLFALVHGIVFTWCSMKCAFRLTDRVYESIRLAVVGLLPGVESVGSDNTSGCLPFLHLGETE